MRPNRRFVDGSHMSRSAAKKQSKTPAPAAAARKARGQRAAAVPSPAIEDAVPATAVDAPADGPCVVGVGASAGGFEPIKKLLSITPPDGGLAYVVIQHLDPTQKSLSTELFARRTQMAVAEAADGVREIGRAHV